VQTTWPSLGICLAKEIIRSQTGEANFAVTHKHATRNESTTWALSEHWDCDDDVLAGLRNIFEFECDSKKSLGSPFGVISDGPHSHYSNATLLILYGNWTDIESSILDEQRQPYCSQVLMFILAPTAYQPFLNVALQRLKETVGREPNP